MADRLHLFVRGILGDGVASMKAAVFVIFCFLRAAFRVRTFSAAYLVGLAFHEKSGCEAFSPIPSFIVSSSDALVSALLASWVPKWLEFRRQTSRPLFLF